MIENPMILTIHSRPDERLQELTRDSSWTVICLFSAYFQCPEILSISSRRPNDHLRLRPEVKHNQTVSQNPELCHFRPCWPNPEIISDGGFWSAFGAA
jgi:hypothetical protein